MVDRDALVGCGLILRLAMVLSVYSLLPDVWTLFLNCLLSTVYGTIIMNICPLVEDTVERIKHTFSTIAVFPITSILMYLFDIYTTPPAHCSNSCPRTTLQLDCLELDPEQQVLHEELASQAHQSTGTTSPPNATSTTLQVHLQGHLSGIVDRGLFIAGL